MSQRLPYLVAIVCGLMVAGTSCGQSQPWDEQAAVEAARQALAHRGSYPWYDAENDTLRPLPVAAVPPPPAAREWTSDTSRESRQTPTWNWSWSAFFAEALQMLVWVFLAVVFVAAAIYVGRAMLRRETLQALIGDRNSLAAPTAAERERIASLPFAVRRSQTDLLGEARRQYEAGNYGEAVVYLFSYQLVQLDKSHWIRLTQGKTNRQYLRELGQHLELRNLLLNTMRTFEDFFFGDHAIDRQRFETCWSRLDDFHRMIAATGT